jgi:hypothetical protein
MVFLSGGRFLLRIAAGIYLLSADLLPDCERSFTIAEWRLCLARDIESNGDGGYIGVSW